MLHLSGTCSPPFATDTCSTPLCRLGSHLNRCAVVLTSSHPISSLPTRASLFPHLEPVPHLKPVPHLESLPRLSQAVCLVDARHVRAVDAGDAQVRWAAGQHGERLDEGRPLHRVADAKVHDVEPAGAAGGLQQGTVARHVAKREEGRGADEDLGEGEREGQGQGQGQEGGGRGTARYEAGATGKGKEHKEQR